MKRRYVPVFLFLVALVLATGIVATGFLLYRSQRDSCRTEAERNLNSVADLKVSEISMWRKNLWESAGIFYKNHAFSNLVRRSIERPQDGPLQEEIQAWMGRVLAGGQYDRVALLDAAGDRWMSLPDRKEPLSSLTTKKAREVLRSGQLTFADFYPNEYSRKVYIRLFVPIFDEQADGRPLGVLMLRIDPAVYLYPFIQRWPTPSETAETLLIRREGNEAVFLNELKFQENTALALRVSLDSTDLPAVKAILHEEGVVEGVDYRGVPVLAAVRAVPDSPWFLVAKRDMAEVYAPMRETLWVTVIFVGVLLYGVRAAWGFLWQQQHATLYRQKYESEAMLSCILNSIPHSIFWKDCNGAYLGCNEVFARRTGLSPEKIVGKTDFDLPWSREEAEAYRADDQDVMTSGRAKTHIVERQHQADGSCIWLDTTKVPLFDSENNVHRILGIYEDVSDRKALERRESLWAEILVLLNSSHALPDVIHRILAAIQQATGFDAVGIRLQNGDDFPYLSQNGFSRDFLVAENTLIVRGQDGGPCRDKDGQISLECTCGVVLSGKTDPASPFCTPAGSFWTNDALPFLDVPADQDPRIHPRNRCIHAGFRSVALIPIRVDQKIVGLLQLNDRKENGLTLEMVHFFEGIGSSIGVALMRKSAEDNLLRAQAELQQYAAALESSNRDLEEFSHIAEAATRAKSDFLANMSHEIRTPMTAILGYADIMLEENVGRATREHVEVIKRNGKHLMELINDILDLSKVEAGKMQIEPTRCSPSELVAEVVLLMRVRADAKHLNLVTELTGPIPETVLTDPLRLRQVLVNLVGNAIKFTDQGEVRIMLRLGEEHGRPCLSFEVIDTGIGMNDDQVQQLFQPFSQVDNSSTRKFGGTGLGLCISKRLAEALGGRIEVRSKPSKGSVFSVTIDTGPLDGIRMLRAGQDAVVRSMPLSSQVDDDIELHGKVLLAEDGPDNQRLIRFLLRKAGTDVVAVENGQLAVETAVAAYEVGGPFDVILMDMQMPVMDGYTATRRLREWGYTGPIVALTAHAMDHDCQKCLDAGCDDYATKPIDRQKLLATVAHWTARGQSRHVAPSCSEPFRSREAATCNSLAASPRKST